MKTLSLEKRKKLINIQTFIIIASAFFLVFILPTAYAKDDNTQQLAMAEQILSGPLKVVKEISDNSGIFAGLWEAATGGNFESINAMQVIFDLFKILGAFFALGIALAHISDNVQRDQGMDVVWKCIMELMVTFIILINLTEILDAISTTGVAILSEIGMNGDDATISASAEDLLSSISSDGESSGGWMWRAGVNAILIVPWIISYLITIAAKFAIIQILIEILIRKVFAPLAVANVYKDGLRSPGARYLLRYLGTFLKLAVCAIITVVLPAFVSLGGSEINGDTGAAFDYIFSIIAVNFTVVTLMLKAGEYTNDIVGV